jgi:chorismate synthase
MKGNTFGTYFKITTYGESHGEAVGVYIEGCPKDFKISLDEMQEELNRRRPGKSEITSPRNEPDNLEVLSGIDDQKTTGETIQLQVKNINVQSSDYDEILYKPRPGHADMTYFQKYGKIPVGGGRASGRETIGRVLAGAIAKQLLLKQGVKIQARIIMIHAVTQEMDQEILRIKDDMDSVGGIIEITATGIPEGLGEPVFDKLDADIAKALMSIGGVKGVEFGSGFQSAKIKGSENNDPIIFESGKLRTETNNAGGILGGISNGMPIVCRIAVKPTSSIGMKQKTVDIKTMQPTTIKVKGRHDPCICTRVVPVAESMMAIVLVDHLLMNKLI